MLRLIVLVLIVTGLALGMSRIADRPGALVIDWLGYQVKTDVFTAGVVLLLVVALLLFLWSLLRFLLSRPAAAGGFLRERKRQRGLEALSKGMIAVGAGDRDKAKKYAALAHLTVPDEPLTALLRGQAAQLHGDRAGARKIFEAMTGSPETELFGLHGLFLEAKRENEFEAARQFAERALRRNPKLVWSADALFELQCQAGDWDGALKTLATARDHKLIDRATAARRCAVLLTAQAKQAEESDVDRARELALEAHKLAPNLVPAAVIAGRLLASQGNTVRAARVLAKTWRLSPHPDIAFQYAHARPGDAPRDRMKRVKTLAQSPVGNVEGPIAVATEAVEGRDWETARAALEPLLKDRPSARVCTLMARIEGGELGDTGRVREWLARAVRAPRDPTWTADGAVSDEWAPVSPVTGRLDAFEWRVPVERLGADEEALIIDGPAETAAPRVIEAARATAAAVTAGAPVEATETDEAPVEAEAAADEAAVEEEAPVKTEEVSAAGDGQEPAPADGEPAPEATAEEAATGAPPEILIPSTQPDDPGPEPADADDGPAGRPSETRVAS